MTSSPVRRSSPPVRQRGGRWPWGSGSAPALRCDECRQPIGKRRTHFVTVSGNLLCPNCWLAPDAHAKYYPGCPERWHDTGDHALSCATRAAAWFVVDDPASSQEKEEPPQ